MGFVIEVLLAGCVVVVLPLGCVVLAGVVVVVLVDDVVLPDCTGVAIEDGADGIKDGVIGSPGFGSGLDVIPAINSLRPVSELLFRYL